MSRASAAAALVLLAASLVLPGPAPSSPTPRRMIVLGIDGMDPELLSGYMKEGVVPNLSKLASQGGFIKLATSIPPQSPVAWSNVITGMGPGGHGIFDFIALDRKTLLPRLSVARVERPSRAPLALGRWRIPLASAHTRRLRDGKAFWEVLAEHGVMATIFRMPANYPPVHTDGRALSGMGTPDLRGTPGTFSFYTDAPTFDAGPVSGGVIRRVRAASGAYHASIEGPPDPFLADSPPATAELVVHVDPVNPVAEIRVGHELRLLNVGEWSNWVPIRFALLPGLVDVPGIVRFYLKQTSPFLQLYASPVNIDPDDPAQPISVPPEYGRELADAVGRFYTQEMPEDTKALSAHVLTTGEFLTQSGLVLDESRRLLEAELARFRADSRGGLLFFYFSSIDQRSHMLWRQMDHEHPFHDSDTPADLANALRSSYREFDELIGTAIAALDANTRLVVMSDHGFAPFRRQAHLNSWLEQNGYLTLADPEQRSQAEWLSGFDWAHTRAFAIGLNSLYLNVRGRERFGSVDPAQRRALAQEIADKLQAWTDPTGGRRVVTQALLREDAYSGPHVSDAPDIIVGYARGYRASWATTSGKVPQALVEDNDREWSGDHCMDSRVVPGVLISSAPLAADTGGLRDVPVSILSYFGIEAPAQMQGHALF